MMKIKEISIFISETKLKCAQVFVRMLLPPSAFQLRLPPRQSAAATQSKPIQTIEARVSSARVPNKQQYNRRIVKLSETK